jgi:hypothetical protein
MATVLGLRRTSALDSEMIAVGCGPIPGIRGRTPDGEWNEAAIVEWAQSELLDVVKALCGMVNEDRRLSSQLDELMTEMARLHAELEREIARGMAFKAEGKMLRMMRSTAASWALSSNSGGWLPMGARLRRRDWKRPVRIFAEPMT